MMKFWNMEVWSEVTWGQMIVLLIWVLGAMLAGKAVQVALTSIGKRKHLEKRKTLLVLLKSLNRPIPVTCFTIGLNMGLKVFSFSAEIQEIVDDVFGILFIFCVAFFVYSVIDVLDYVITHVTSKTHTKMDNMMAPMVRKSLRIVVVTLALVQVAQRLSDKPITSLLAGLGVGGLAVALAAQETIKNFFGSLVIFADKPFELGERIVVSGQDGVVEEVGFRSTRIRTLSGHLVTIPNGELANLMIENVGKRPYIKRVMDIGITYNTPPEKVQQALDILKELLDNHEGINADFPPRVFFADFGNFSLNLRAIYWYHPAEYWDYIAFSEKINMQLLQRYNEAGIEFAFPTQTLYVNQEDK
ncbi:MAG: mechanosensitive ion channel family protein [Pontiellaceae bacterium]|nr:mechanosensitive ion channel family protein [Pontiellaceae bacterium]